MKNSIQRAGSALFVLSIFLLIGCENTQQAEWVSAEKSLAVLLYDIAELGRSEKKIISFDIVYDKRSGAYSFANVELIKESKKITDFVKGADPAFKYAAGSYEVECTDAEGNTETTICETYACVGYAVAICVENGGCAEVCKTDAIYYPPEIE